MRILLVEDDEELSRFLLRVLREEGLDVVPSDCAREALTLLKQQTFQLVVLDRMLPDLDGLAVCTEIRRQSRELPILMLTARGELEDRVSGLDSGADDYVVKPFEVEELLARIRALLRRAASPLLVVGPLRLEWRRRSGSIDGTPLELTAREYALLEHLAREPNRVVSRAELLEGIWQTRFDPGTNVVEVYVNRVRNKLGRHAPMLETVKGVGYLLRGA
jgi:two-component system, OmpR family, response regulator